MPEVDWLDAARRELEEVAAVLMLNSERAARRVVASLKVKAARLGEHPRLGPRRGDLGKGFRMLVHGPYILFYRTVPDTDGGPVRRVEVVSVIDGRRDLPALYGSREAR